MLSIYSWNVNGIRASYSKGLLDWIEKVSPDILCIQETKANRDQLPKKLINIPGYNSYFSSAMKEGYSGVCIYSKIVPLNVTSVIGIDKFDSEGRILIAEYKHFNLYNVYIPNGKASNERLKYKLDFYQVLLEQLKRNGKGIVVCGDMNTAHKDVDLHRPKENSKISGFLPEERKWISKFLESGFIDTYRQFNKEGNNYSWWDYKSRARDRNVGWRIDYFFISKDLKNILRSAEIHSDVFGSDHCPISITLDIE